MPRFQGKAFGRKLGLVDAPAAEAVGVTPAQLALACVLARGPRVAAIPGSRSVARLRENVDAARIY